MQRNKKLYSLHEEIKQSIGRNFTNIWNLENTL